MAVELRVVIAEETGEPSLRPYITCDICGRAITPQFAEVCWDDNHQARILCKTRDIVNDPGCAAKTHMVLPYSESLQHFKLQERYGLKPEYKS